MKKIIYISFFLILAGGCHTSLNQNWKDFKAYYNTHYNTKKFFDEGLEKNQNQVPEINPKYPIRVHVSPGRAGAAEFEKAIEGGATILREHDESSFVEPALAIIGMSYYYRSELFSALEKFQELNSISEGKYRQEAILWEGLVLLEMQSFNEGISFIESELLTVSDWDRELLAETKTVLAQHYVEREEWGEAAKNLGEALDDLSDSRLKARAFFLYGQILEKLDMLDEALLAYNEVPKYHPPYTLIFNAQKKQAELFRKMGEFDRALNMFAAMARDDKNIDERPDLNYEVARTHQLRGNYEEAAAQYNRILRNELRPANPVTKAKVYYGLGEIYRFHEQNFRIAAAYYDSAASQRAVPDRLPEWFDAPELAKSFGEYAKTKNEIARIDSLLELGTMEPAQLDSVLTILQRKQEQERQEELKRIRDQRDVMVAVDTENIESTTDTDAIRNNGFLNIRNQRVKTDASIQFRAVWGDRPLVDNWRREEAVTGSRITQIADSDAEQIVEEDGLQGLMARYTLDVSEIPLEAEQQDSMRSVLNEKYYRLANVFFLSLNLPDSAVVYFKKTAENDYNPDVIPGSLYTLGEIEFAEGREQKAMEYALKLIERYPQTEFANRLRNRLGDLNPDSEYESELPKQLAGLELDLENHGARGTYLRLYAMNDAAEEQVPLLLYDAAVAYMQEARERETDPGSISRWHTEMSNWEAKKNELKSLKDSARVVLSDNDISDSEREYWQNIADSTLSEPDFSQIYPFNGGYWDSTRVVLNHIDSYYTTSRVMPKVKRLQE
ncbi:MAG: tetratricopeptide repeat protein, partial [Balneolaceae bacterium]